MYAHRVDGAGACRHPGTDSAAFESRSRGRGRAQDSVAAAQYNFAIGADIEQRVRGGLLIKARGNHAGQQVAAHEAAEAGQELHLGAPAELPGAEAALPEFGGEERHGRQGLHAEAAKEVVHGGVAHNQHLFQGAAAGRPRQHLAQSPPDHDGQFTGVPQVVLYAAHDVGAVPRLGVERRLDGQHRARRQIHQLRHQRGGAEVDGRAQTVARFERRLAIVREHRQRPLLHFDHDALARLGAAGQTPALGEFRLGQGLPHGRRDGNVAGKDADLAPATGALPAARELDAQFE